MATDQTTTVPLPPTIPLGIEALNFAASQFREQADVLKFAADAKRAVADNLVLAANICQRLADLRFEVAEIAAKTTTQSPEHTARELRDALDDAAKGV